MLDTTPAHHHLGTDPGHNEPGIYEIFLTDDIGDVVSYDDIMNNLRQIAAGEHINLLEVLAERIAGLCLGDPRVLRVRVAVAKLDIYGGTGIPGIRIERRRKAPRLPYEEV